jgi:hypothetical protein
MKPPFPCDRYAHYEPLLKKLIHARRNLSRLKVRVGEILAANSESRSRAGDCSDRRTI